MKKITSIALLLILMVYFVSCSANTNEGLNNTINEGTLTITEDRNQVAIEFSHPLLDELFKFSKESLAIEFIKGDEVLYSFVAGYPPLNLNEWGLESIYTNDEGTQLNIEHGIDGTTISWVCRDIFFMPLSADKIVVKIASDDEGEVVYDYNEEFIVTDVFIEYDGEKQFVVNVDEDVDVLSLLKDETQTLTWVSKSFNNGYEEIDNLVIMNTSFVNDELNINFTSPLGWILEDESSITLIEENGVFKAEISEFITKTNMQLKNVSFVLSIEEDSVLLKQTYEIVGENSSGQEARITQEYTAKLKNVIAN